MAESKTVVSNWEALASRVPRPGYFLGDDMASCSLSNDAVLLPDSFLSPSWDLGLFCRLPVELLHPILADVAEADPRALLAFRNINRATAALVHGIRDFATVAAFPRALAALVLLAPAPGRGIPVSMAALAACLRTTECACCRRAFSATTKPESHHARADTVHFGDLIYLLTPERVCYLCFRSCPEYLPMARPLASTSTSTGSLGRTGDKQHTTIVVPPARYGILSATEHTAEIQDSRQVLGYHALPPQNAAERSKLQATHRSAGQPANFRYATVIPGPYWQEADDRPAELERGFGCLACLQTNRREGHSGWANPLIRYTKSGLQQHIADPRFGGRVLTWCDKAGIVHYEHDAPREKHFPPAKEFGLMADLARRYNRVLTE